MGWFNDYLDPLRGGSYSRPKKAHSVAVTLSGSKQQEVIFNEKFCKGSSNRGFYRGY